MSIIHGMTHADYLSAPGLSASFLKAIRRSPAHAFGKYMDPNRPAEKDSKAKNNGTLAHCLHLDPETFDQRFIVVPEDAPNRPSVRQRKAAKPSAQTVEAIKWWDEFDRVAAGRMIVDADKLESAKAQAASLRRLPEVADLMRSGNAEVSAFWERDGIACKARPDFVADVSGGVILIDLKTCSDAGPAGFARAIANYSYDLQAAWYCKGYEAASGSRVLGFVFAAVESEWPHVAAAYVLQDDQLAEADAECARLAAVYEQCNASGAWPGYQSTIQPISLPTWAMRRNEAQQ